MRDDETNLGTVNTAPEEDASWKINFQRQRLLIGSITALLNKYGSTTDIELLQNTFLLTIMGHYLVTDACYYAGGKDDRLVPAAVYGRLRMKDLPTLGSNGELVAKLLADRSPILTSSSAPWMESEDLGVLVNGYHVITPLMLKEQLIGILFLGAKATEKEFDEFDYEVLCALCATSATTFNNAALYRNAKTSEDEIKRLYALRAEIVSRITHEFRTPLTVIRASFEILEHDSRHAEMRSWLQPAVERLEDLIEDLLRLGNDNKVTLEKLSYDPIPTISRSIMACASPDENEGIVKLQRLPHSEEPRVRVGRRNIGTLVESLVDNAVKFSGKHPIVTVKVGVTRGPIDTDAGVELPNWEAHTFDLVSEYVDVTKVKGHEEETVESDATDTSHWLVIEVSDNGIGIPAADITFIAEPFRQASNSPNAGVKGKGLGLAIAQKIACQYGGFIYCDSELGVGSTFTAYLPAD